jgi:hypothetical protein
MSRHEHGRLDTCVFSGEWLQSTDPCCRHRYRVGFAGTPAGAWNGWRLFTGTRPVMTSVVVCHHSEMAQLITTSVAAGAPLDQAWLDALAHMASLSWLGRRVIVDSRIRQHDPTAVEVIAPDGAGRYRVGFGWSWTAVDPAQVHTIHRTAYPTSGRRPIRRGSPAGNTEHGSTRREP